MRLTASVKQKTESVIVQQTTRVIKELKSVEMENFQKKKIIINFFLGYRHLELQSKCKRDKLGHVALMFDQFKYTVPSLSSVRL